VKKLGGLEQIMGMIPGMGKMKLPDAQVNEKELTKVDAIISSMTRKSGQTIPSSTGVAGPHRERQRHPGAGCEPAPEAVCRDEEGDEVHVGGKMGRWGRCSAEGCRSKAKPEFATKSRRLEEKQILLSFAS